MTTHDDITFGEPQFEDLMKSPRRYEEDKPILRKIMVDLSSPENRILGRARTFSRRSSDVDMEEFSLVLQQLLIVLDDMGVCMIEQTELYNQALAKLSEADLDITITGELPDAGDAAEVIKDLTTKSSVTDSFQDTMIMAVATSAQIKADCLSLSESISQGMLSIGEVIVSKFRSISSQPSGSIFDSGSRPFSDKAEEAVALIRDMWKVIPHGPVPIKQRSISTPIFGNVSLVISATIPAGESPDPEYGYNYLLNVSIVRDRETFTIFDLFVHDSENDGYWSLEAEWNVNDVADIISSGYAASDNDSMAAFHSRIADFAKGVSRKGLNPVFINDGILSLEAGLADNPYYQMLNLPYDATGVDVLKGYLAGCSNIKDIFLSKEKDDTVQTVFNVAAFGTANIVINGFATLDIPKTIVTIGLSAVPYVGPGLSAAFSAGYETVQSVKAGVMQYTKSERDSTKETLYPSFALWSALIDDTNGYMRNILNGFGNVTGHDGIGKTLEKSSTACVILQDPLLMAVINRGPDWPNDIRVDIVPKLNTNDIFQPASHQQIKQSISEGYGDYTVGNSIDTWSYFGLHINYSNPSSAMWKPFNNQPKYLISNTQRAPLISDDLQLRKAVLRSIASLGRRWASGGLSSFKFGQTTFGSNFTTVFDTEFTANEYSRFEAAFYGDFSAIKSWDDVVTRTTSGSLAGYGLCLSLGYPYNDSSADIKQHVLGLAMLPAGMNKYGDVIDIDLTKYNFQNTRRFLTLMSAFAASAASLGDDKIPSWHAIYEFFIKHMQSGRSHGVQTGFVYCIVADMIYNSSRVCTRLDYDEAPRMFPSWNWPEISSVTLKRALVNVVTQIALPMAIASGAVFLGRSILKKSLQTRSAIQQAKIRQLASSPSAGEKGTADNKALRKAIVGENVNQTMASLAGVSLASPAPFAGVTFDSIEDAVSAAKEEESIDNNEFNAESGSDDGGTVKKIANKLGLK